MSFVKLPKDILQQLFLLCDISSIIQLLSTCKYLHNFLSQNNLWMLFVERDFQLQGMKELNEITTMWFQLYHNLYYFPHYLSNFQSLPIGSIDNVDWTHWKCILDNCPNSMDFDDVSESWNISEEMKFLSFSRPAMMNIGNKKIVVAPKRIPNASNLDVVLFYSYPWEQISLLQMEFNEEVWLCEICHNFNWGKRIKCNRCNSFQRPLQIVLYGLHFILDLWGSVFLWSLI